MSKIMLIAVILIPVFAGVLVPVIPFKKRKYMEIFLETAVIFNTLLVWFLLYHRPVENFVLANLQATWRLPSGWTAWAWCLPALFLSFGLWPLCSLLNI